MTRRVAYCLVVLALLTGSELARAAQSQPRPSQSRKPRHFVKITMRNGDPVVGDLVEIENGVVVVQTFRDVRRIDGDQIQTVRPISHRLMALCAKFMAVFRPDSGPLANWARGARHRSGRAWGLMWELAKVADTPEDRDMPFLVIQGCRLMNPAAKTDWRHEALKACEAIAYHVQGKEAEYQRIERSLREPMKPVTPGVPFIRCHNSASRSGCSGRSTST